VELAYYETREILVYYNMGNAGNMGSNGNSGINSGTGTLRNLAKNLNIFYLVNSAPKEAGLNIFTVCSCPSRGYY